MFGELSLVPLWLPQNYHVTVWIHGNTRHALDLAACCARSLQA